MTAMSKAIRSGRQCRKHGMTAVSKALYRMFIEDSGLAKKRILDFGAGLAAVQTVLLRKVGLDVTAYDLPENRVEGGLHDPYALSRRYDIVMCSNLLNVQPDLKHVLEVAWMAAAVLAPDGFCLMNYPSSPRYGRLSRYGGTPSPGHISACLDRVFVIHRLGQALAGHNIIWKCESRRK